MKDILPFIRKKAFHLTDYLSRSNIRNQYNEIGLIDNLNSDDTKVIHFQKQALDQLVEYASNKTIFYRNIDRDSFFDFPVITKNIIKANQSSFLSLEFEKEKLYTMSTSGSTGSPFISYQNAIKKRRVNAEVIYYSEKAGYDVGQPLVYLRAIPKESSKSKIIQWAQNEKLININNLGEQTIDSLINELKKTSSNTTILAYASTLDLISNYCKNKGITFIKKIAGVISSSELLTDETRTVISKLFACKVSSRYANQENGLLGQDAETNNNFIINEASYYIEIFDLYEDKLLEDGQIGRIVVTDLYNKAMPIIRYDTGDIGSKELISTNGKLKYSITNFSGRRLDIITDIKGNKLSPHSISNSMWKFKEVKEFQFRQKSADKYIMKIVLNKKSDIKDEVYKIIADIVGKEAKINIEFVNNIAKLPSGKSKYIINDLLD